MKRDLGARTTAPKKSQQPGYPPPRGGPPKGLTIHVQGSGPLKGFTNHRKLRELAETLVHPRLKTERGNSPSPTTHSCRKEKLRAKNQGPKAKVQEEPTASNLNSDRNTGRETGNTPRARKLPQAECLSQEQTRPSKKRAGQIEAKHCSSYESNPQRNQRAAGRGGCDPVDSRNPRGRQGLPEETWLVPKAKNKSAVNKEVL